MVKMFQLDLLARCVPCLNLFMDNDSVAMYHIQVQDGVGGRWTNPCKNVEKGENREGPAPVVRDPEFQVLKSITSLIRHINS